MNLIVLGLWQARLVAAVLLKVMNGKCGVGFFLYHICTFLKWTSLQLRVLSVQLRITVSS